VAPDLREVFGFDVPVVGNFPAESRLDGFANAAERLSVSPVLLEYYGQAAAEMAAAVAGKSSEFLTCPLQDLAGGTCLGTFLRTVGSKAWRRPLGDEEVSRFTKLYTDAAAALGPEGGFKTVVEGLLLSANFLFRTELGDPAAAKGNIVPLTGLELASAMSYLIWDAPPDAELMRLADQGKLEDPEVRAAEARRLLAKAQAAPAALHDFLRQWLETEDFLRKEKDPEVFPEYSPEMAQDLVRETERFVEEVVFEAGGDRSLTTLLTAPWGYLNARTAKLYGATAAGPELGRTELDPSQRRGLFTQASFLAAHAEPAATSVVARGRFIREEVLCSAVPPPPEDFKFDEKVITEDMTAREKFIEHSKNPSCAACHALFDSLGFALENYDAIGQYRTTEKGKTIDPSGELPLDSGQKVPFDNFIDLVEKLAKGKEAYACFAAQYLQYASGRLKLDRCETENLARAFVDSGHRLDALVAAWVSAPGFASRRQ